MDISSYVPGFIKWLKSDKSDSPDWMLGWEEERDKRRSWYKENLGPDNILNLNEESFSKLIKDLWATLIWSNKDYKVKKLIEDNSLPKIKEHLNLLLYGTEPLDKRWDYFRKSIKGFGPSSMSEILAFSNSNKYGIVNLKPLSLLPVLGVISENEIQKYTYNSLDGKKYADLLEILSKVRELLQNYGLPNADFIDTDFFIAYLFL